MKYLRPVSCYALLFLVLVLPFYGQVRIDEVEGRSTPAANRDRGQRLLKIVKETLKEYYYDKKFRGIDVDARFKDANERIKKLDTNSQIFRVIAALLLEFNDSHTRFYPPGRSNRTEYGFSMQMIGNNCVIVDVAKGSDAEKKGLKVGDQLARIGQHAVTRDTLWLLKYHIYQLEPMPLLPLTLRDTDGKERDLLIQASIKTLEQRKKEREKDRREKEDFAAKCVKLSFETTACKLRTFVVDKKVIDQMMKHAMGSSKLILDLRGNGGGYVKIEEYLTGHFFESDVKIGEVVMRDKTETRTAKAVGKDRQFKGELIVLIDSDSASASEMFARVIQLEKRGKIVGDVSAGAVMTSYNIPLSDVRGPDGFQTVTLFGMNVTVADVIMSDGKRLEQVGVLPDHPVGPSGLAIALRNDPVLAFAAGLMGTRISPEEAGKFEFLFKKPEADSDPDDDGSEKP